MTIWKRDLDIHSLKHFVKNTMIEFLEIEFLQLGSDFLTASMPVGPKTVQPLGSLHGGASCVLAETVGSVAGYLCLDERHYCLGLEINTNHIRPVTWGKVTATAKPIHLGKTTQVWNIEIVNDDNKIVAVSRLTNAVLTHKDA